MCVFFFNLFFKVFASMNGGLIFVYQVWLKRTLGSKLLKWWTFFVSLPNCLHGFGGKDVPCAKRIVVLYEKSFISPSSLSINGAKITSLNLFSNLVKHFHSPNWQVHNWDVQKKINNFFRIVIKFHMIKLMDSLVYIENKNKIGHRCEVKAFPRHKIIFIQR